LGEVLKSNWDYWVPVFGVSSMKSCALRGRGSSGISETQFLQEVPSRNLKSFIVISEIEQ